MKIEQLHPLFCAKGRAIDMRHDKSAEKISALKLEEGKTEKEEEEDKEEGGRQLVRRRRRFHRRRGIGRIF